MVRSAASDLRLEDFSVIGSKACFWQGRFPGRPTLASLDTCSENGRPLLVICLIGRTIDARHDR
jgi:hypothetical protein